MQVENELQALKARYLIDVKWRDAWLAKANKKDNGRLCTQQEYIDKRAQRANRRIAVIIDKVNALLGVN